MGGMSCNEMSLVPWQILRKSTNLCISIKDINIPETIAMLATKKLSNKKIIGGECSAPGIIGLISVCNNKEIKEKLDLNENSNVLLIGCEGDADKLFYKKLLKKGNLRLSNI